ncbi:hypothetical protein [Halorubrum sp. N11]|uniref:hypothetical protein n=1 Tax=Halorubrum sp. N11 TaxID=3402276 RepID=UPI003EB977C9
MLPDIHWVAPLYAPELKALHSSVFTNVFWFHQTLDVVDPTDSYTVAALALGVFTLVVSLGDHWAYRTQERTTTTTDLGPLTAIRSLDTLVRSAGLLSLICGIGLVGVGSVHSGVGGLQGLYFGVGTALVSTGVLALGGQLAVAPWVTTRLSTTATRGLVVLGSLILTIGGGTLVGSLLRHGLTAQSVLMGGVGALLLVLAVVSAHVRLQL